MEHVDPTVFRLAIFVLAIFVGYYEGQLPRGIC